MIERWYILDGHEPRRVAEMEDWARWMASGDRVVAKTDIGEAHVSTVFLGLDHRYFGDGPPLIFETTIFGGPLADWQERCSTWREAEAQHEAACALVRGGLQ